MPFPIVPAIAAATSLIGMGIAKGKDKRQLTQQEKLQNLQIRGQKEMMDYGMQQQYDMWQKTNYKPQLDEMKEAGINPALMYGMGGGGGTTTGSPSGNVTGADAPKGSGREVEEMAGMGMQMAQQMKLLEAQKENIDADTANKKMDTLDKAEGKTGKEYDNIIKDLLVNRDKNGNLIESPEQDKDRVAFKQSVQELEKTTAETLYRVDENKRQELMNSQALNKIREEIELMKKQGKTQEEMANNLNKEGQIKQMEIEWSKMGLTRESLTKFIQLLIMKAL